MSHEKEFFFFWVGRNALLFIWIELETKEKFKLLFLPIYKFEIKKKKLQNFCEGKKLHLKKNNKTKYFSDRRGIFLKKNLREDVLLLS